jgi:hypothetical protein
MPHKQKHRGAHPSDEFLFSEQFQPLLRLAVKDLSWLLSKKYAEKAALKLVGDRYGLKERQRNAVMRCSCSDESMKARIATIVNPEALKDKSIVIDGFNLIITIETALSNGFIFKCRDGCYRDLASVHGNYRKVAETESAIQLIGSCLKNLGVAGATWLLDKPVSNSGKLKSMLEEMAGCYSWQWNARLVNSPDKIMVIAKEIVATSDSMVLDKVDKWTCLAKVIILNQIENARIISFHEVD